LSLADTLHQLLNCGTAYTLTVINKLPACYLRVFNLLNNATTVTYVFQIGLGLLKIHRKTKRKCISEHCVCYLVKYIH